MLNIAVAGAAGRMGRSIIAALRDSTYELCLSGAFQHNQSSLLGVDVGELTGTGNAGLPLLASINQAEFDLLIDFSQIQSSLDNLQYCIDNNKAIVIGTTGFTVGEQEQIRAAGEKIPVILAANTSVGMNLCFHLVKQMSQVLGQDSDIEIIETHHRHKVDSPSGTAMRLGQEIATSLGRDLSKCAVYGREGIGLPRDHETIGFATIRGGDVAGDHTVLFASEGERVELTHKASSRMTFANGAVRAAAWLGYKSPGFYDMQDVLSLRG